MSVTPGRLSRLVRPFFSFMTLRRRGKTADGQTVRTDCRSSTRSPFVFETLEPRLLLSAGLTAGYAFNETAGTTAADASGHAIVGTLTNGPTWTAGQSGQYGNAINLDGVNDYVNLGNPVGLQITGSMTLSGWINASAFPVDDAAVVSKRASGESGFQLDVTVDTGPRTIGFKLTNSAGANMLRYGATTLQPNTWYYIAGVYDAATQSLHVYLNGQLDDGVLQGTVTASQQNSTLNVNIGRRAGATGYEFAGRVDDVRIYDRALTAAEIQTDMVTSLGAPDTIAPTVTINQAVSQTDPTSASPINFTVVFSETVTGFASNDISFAGSTVGGTLTAVVTGTGPTYTVAVSGMTGTGTVVASVLAGAATDAAGNLNLASTSTDNTVTFDTTVPSVAVTAPASGSTLSGMVTVTADASDNVGVAGAQFLLDGAPLGTEDTTFPYSVSWNTTGVTNGSHTLLARARDAAGNLTTSSPITVTVANTQTAGLTAGYAFDETSGTTAADASGHGIVGTLVNGPTWTTGRYGNALTLDGVNDYVNLGNPTALQLTGSLTLSGWINASSFPVDDAAVVSKRASGPLGFQLDVTKDTGPRTIGFKLTNSAGANMLRYGATTLQPNTWYHITGVYDAASQSLHVYLNGQLDDGILQGTVTASQQNSTINVTIGRRAGATGFEFAGRVDDVRIYSRALTAAEIQTDMLTSLGASAPDTIAPTVQAINRMGPTPTNAVSVQWMVTFSEAVTGVDLTDFALVASGVAGATVTNVSGSGSSYTVTANTGGGSGTLGLNLVDNDSILDGSANPLGGPGAGTGTFTGQS